ncbi:MAG: sodium-dependent transporter [Lachnospiraceae bacterium]|nr:sodium-dependent transporter [Lachnospiraceae bacterium]
MAGEKRGQWNSSFTFILASIGSAVGLGNAWRFPGLAAKYGGGTFIFVYVFMLIILGIPLLMMEISIGRKTQSGAINAIGSLNKKLQWIGWSATVNSFVIVTYYAVVFAWVILMALISFKFAGLTGDSEAAGKLWMQTIQTTGTTEGFVNMSTQAMCALVLAWIIIYYCIRNGASSVSKVVKFTVFAPVVCLVIMAVKGIFMPGGMAGLIRMCTPDLTQLLSADIWIDAVGQVFYSLSIMMAIMFAYGSYLPKSTNIARDAVIIAVSDLGVSLLSSVVMFTTMGGVGMLDNMSTSGVATAFIIYPQAMVKLTNSGIFNACFAFIFYFCLCTLAIDSAFSIVEGVSASISDKFRISAKKTTIGICLAASAISIIFVTGAGLAFLDIVDYYANNINLVLVGILETIAVGWFFKTGKVLEEINKNAKKFKMPGWWFLVSVKVIAPVLLVGFFGWNLYSLIAKNHGVYGAADGYSVAANVALGWIVSAVVILSGIVFAIIERVKYNDGRYDPTPWDECKGGSDVSEETVEANADATADTSADATTDTNADTNAETAADANKETAADAGKEK